jgi:hypothetical protein
MTSGICGGIDATDSSQNIHTLRVFLDAKSIEVSLEKGLECRCKLADVMVGPFDL